MKDSLQKEGIDKCVERTFDTEGKKSFQEDGNVYMALSRKEWEEIGSNTFPLAMINGEKFRGQFNADNVFEEICSSFTNMPLNCKALLIKYGYTHVTRGLSTKELLIIVGALIVINLVVFMFYRQHLKQDLDKEMKMQVTSEVSKYVALSQIKELNMEENMALQGDNSI
jgi:hypothetical protein